MKKELIKLKLTRGRLENVKKAYQEKYDQFQQENRDLLSIIEKHKLRILELEGAIEEFALNVYKETGKKSLDYGVGIRIYKKLEYQPESAFEWALEHKMALQLNKKDFEKIAKTSPMDFVKIIEEPKATMPSEINIEGDLYDE